MKSLFTIALFSFIFNCFPGDAQAQKTITEEDQSALEGIIVENYYVYNPADALDTVGGALPQGAVTYRIYADMKPGYKLQAVYGVPDHELNIKTTTHFFNNAKWGDISGDKIDDKKIVNSTAAFDSWITIGAATQRHSGVLKSEDTDGSLITALPNADGMMTAKIKPVTFFGFDITFFSKTLTPAKFSGNNGSWAVFGSVKGETSENKVLIAQLTTDGILSFELNMQIGTPTGATLNFVAKNPKDKEIQVSSLVH